MAGKRKPQWGRIRTEYITGSLSQRKLADKHGVSLAELGRRCKQESWVALRREHQGKTMAMALEKISDAQAEQMAVELTAAAGELLAMVRKGIGNLDRPVRSNKVKIEGEDGSETTTEWLTQDAPNGIVDLKGAKAAANALRDVYTILGLKTELERQEQEARIAALRARVPAGDDDGGVRHGVVLLPQVEPPTPPEEDSDG